MGAREVAQGLRINTALSEDTSSVPSTHTGQLATSCNSSPRGSNTLFWTPRAHLSMHTFPQFTHTIKKNLKAKTESEVVSYNRGTSLMLYSPNQDLAFSQRRVKSDMTCRRMNGRCTGLMVHTDQEVEARGWGIQAKPELCRNPPCPLPPITVRWYLE